MKPKKTVTVENHQPVPLRPLREVLEEAEHVIWVGPLINRDDADEPDRDPVGWLAAGQNDEWLEIEDSLSTYGNYSYPATYLFLLESYGIDLDRTMARTLQPGEVIHVTYGGQP